MNDIIYLTKEGKRKLQEELADLKGPQRKALSLRLKTAIEMGDLSENADYISAKENQGFLEGRILEIEMTLKGAVMVDKANFKHGEVNIGTKVTIQEVGYPPETYYLVGLKEADPSNDRISYESPFGKALIGHTKGDIVVAETPNGKIKLKILKIE